MQNISILTGHKKLFERMFQYMPTYHNKENWKNRGRVIITAFPWYRRLPILKSIIPYHVGDQVVFYLRLENQNTSVSLSHHVFEKFGNNDINQLPYNLKEAGEIKIIGNVINAEGDVFYGIGYSRQYMEQPDTIFHAKVISWDSIFHNYFLMIISAIFGGIVSVFVIIVTGLVKISDDGYLLIPEWLIKWLR